MNVAVRSSDCALTARGCLCVCVCPVCRVYHTQVPLATSVPSARHARPHAAPDRMLPTAAARSAACVTLASIRRSSVLRRAFNAGRDQHVPLDPALSSQPVAARAHSCLMVHRLPVTEAVLHAPMAARAQVARRRRSYAAQVHMRGREHPHALRALPARIRTCQAQPTACIACRGSAHEAHLLSFRALRAAIRMSLVSSTLTTALRVHLAHLARLGRLQPRHAYRAATARPLAKPCADCASQANMWPTSAAQRAARV